MDPQVWSLGSLLLDHPGRPLDIGLHLEQVFERFSGIFAVGDVGNRSSLAGELDRIVEVDDTSRIAVERTRITATQDDAIGGALRITCRTADQAP